MNEISLQQYCEQIENIIEQGRYAKAVAHGKHILELYPKYVTAYLLLGKAMLEAGQDEYATDMFHRVLSADPEELFAWVGMSEVHNRRDELNAAIWYLERAFELATDNAVVEEELRRLYGRRDGIEPQRVQLTQGALARLYLKGDLLPRAVSEFRALLTKQPERVDVSVALAEALWRNNQRLEASESCLRVLDELPYCLKANLILGEIWTSSGREEGQTYLQRAETLDPENRMAQELFGTTSPLPAQQVKITPLDYMPPTEEEERPAWMAEVETIPEEMPLLTEREATLVDITAALEAQIEIPPWLEEISVGEEAPATVPFDLAAEPLAEQPLEETAPVPTPAEEIPEWLTVPDEGTVIEEAQAVAEGETPAWLVGLGIAAISDEEIPTVPSEAEAMEWLAELDVKPTVEATEEGIPAAPPEAGIPEWLKELSVEPAGEQAAPPTPPAEQAPDWLAGLREQLPETGEEEQSLEETPLPAAEETPLPAWRAGEELPSGSEAAAAAFGWTAFGEPEAPPEAIAPLEEAPPVEEAALPEAIAPLEEAPLPTWLEGEELPSGDEALAWLEQLTEGKEEELQAISDAEGEARMAEIMGRPAPAKPPPPEEALPVEAIIPPVEQVAAPAAAAAFGWTAFGEPEAPPEAIAPLEEAPPVEEAALPEAIAPLEEAPLPTWLEGEELPSGDEALAWLEQLTEGKEEELQAISDAEGEARMAEIMGRPAPAKPPPPEEALPVEAIIPPVEQVAAPAAAAAFGWTAFGEPEAPPEAIAPLEEAPPVEEAALPEAIAPLEEAPAITEEEAPLPTWLAGEELPSGDEALAWLEQLAAGKEEELQAISDAEAEVRMAKIMGRPAPAKPPPPEEALPEEALIPPVEAIAAPAAAAAFGWTAFGEPKAPPEAITPLEEAPPVEEAALPEAITAVEEALPVEEAAPPTAPEWIPLEEMEEEEEEKIEAPPAIEALAVEEGPPPEEIPAPEIAPPSEEIQWGAALEAPVEVEIAPAPVIEEVPGVVEMEITELIEEPEAPPKAPAIKVPAEPFEAERAYLKEHRRDYEAWLSLARALWQVSEREESLAAYTRVIRAGKFLESVIADLEEYLEQWPAVNTQRVLGDAYMKKGRLQDALDTYRRALETL